MFIVELIDNNNVLAFTNVLFFYTNKVFHSRISFNLNTIDYIIIRKRFNAAKAKEIINYI